MKILLSAHACHPEWVSEHSIGWKVMHMIAKKHDVWLLTSERCRAGMEAAIADGRVPKNVHVHFAGPPFSWPKNPMISKLKEWPYFRSFLSAAYPIAKDLHRSVTFDLAHHLTFASWRVGIPYWKLGIPMILGPIGGGESFDLRFLNQLSPSAAVFELARIGSNWKSLCDPRVRSCLKNASLVLASNPETAAIAVRGGADPERVKSLLVTFFTEEKIQLMRPKVRKDYSGPLRLFAAGNLEGRKGVSLALKALRIVKERGVKFTYRFTMGGPEAVHLKLLTRQLDLTDCVQFSEELPRPEFEALLQGSHIYLLPSLRDNSPSALMEAMLCGCVPVVAGCGGPNLIVTDESGVRVPLAHPKIFINKMAEVILQLHHDRGLLEKLGREATNCIQAAYSETAYASQLQSAYQKANRLSE